MTSSQIKPTASPVNTELRPSGPIAHLELAPPGAPNRDGFLALTISLHNTAGERIRMPPDSRAHIEVGLEPPLTRLEGKRRRQAFGGQVIFRLRLSADVARPQDLKLRAAIADDPGGPRALFDVAWPRQPYAPGALPPPGPDPAMLSFSHIESVQVGQPWHEPVVVWLRDVFSRTCPTSDAPPLVVELRLGQAGRGLDEQRLGPVVARRPARLGVARFHALEPPDAPGRYALHAELFECTDPREWKSIAKSEEAANFVTGRMHSRRITVLSAPFAVTVAPPVLFTEL